MRMLGYCLITLGFLTGSLVAVQSAENSVNWWLFVPAVCLASTGVILARIAAHRTAYHTDSLTVNDRTLRDALERIVENTERLGVEATRLHPSDVHGRIDALLREDLTLFADARKTIAHLHGLKAYAAVMNGFAAGERYVNRVWSASVDGYGDEVRTYLDRAKEQFSEARQVLRDLG